MEKLAVQLDWMSGPPLANMVVSPQGVRPKKEANKFRLIHHLSFPEGASANDGIDPELCSVVYTLFNAAICWVRKFGKGALLAMTDIQSDCCRSIWIACTFWVVFGRLF